MCYGHATTQKSAAQHEVCRRMRRLGGNMTLRISATGIIIATCLPASLPAAVPMGPPTIVQSLEMRLLGNPKVAPDGQRVIFEQSRTDWKSNAFQTDLFMATIGGGAPRLLTNGVTSAKDADWSPDGKWIAFMSDRPGLLPDSPSEKAQLYIMSADGGEARQITRMEKGVEAFDWAPDSASLVFSAELPDAKALKDRKDTFGEFLVIRADYGPVQLWQTQVPRLGVTGDLEPLAEPRQLTKGAFSVGAFSVSPDGRSVAFDAQRDPDLSSASSADIHVLALADGSERTIVAAEGPDVMPRWSPDGRQIAYQTSSKPATFFYANSAIAVVSAAGGPARILTRDFDEDADLLRWTREGIYFAARDKTEAGLLRVNPASGAVTKIRLPGTPLATRFSVTLGDKSRFATYLGAGPGMFPEVYVASVSRQAGKPVKLTSVGDQFAGTTAARREIVSWKSKDGTPIEGVLYKPADFDPKRAYPLLVVIHGGPTGVDTAALTPDRYYPLERFVAKGALVLKPNYRGSAGYGDKFRSLNVRELGVGDYADVISGVDALIAQGFVDKDRVGAMGWSQGGYISAFIATSSDRFKAVSVGAGISDWMTYYVSTDITPFTRQYLLATPWSDPEIYRKTSPISYASGAKTPTLIQHGGSDKRVPIANAYELRQALEDQGVPVKMVVYDGFGHQINKPRQQRAVMEENAAWFDHYIWSEPLAVDLTPDKTPTK